MAKISTIVSLIEHSWCASTSIIQVSGHAFSKRGNVFRI
jgi:hypothetical protein